MARRLGLLGLGLAAILLPLRPTAQADRSALEDGRSRRVAELTHERSVSALHWVALTERDSALALLARDGAVGAVPQVTLQGFPATARAVEAEAAVRGRWEAIGPLDPRVGTGVLIYNQASFIERAWRAAYLGALISRRGGATWCLAIIPGELRPDGSVLAGKRSLERALSPCVLLAAFGEPGTGPRSWLQAGGYRVARSSLWLTRGPNGLEQAGEVPWAPLYDFSAEERRSTGFSLLESVGALNLVMLLTPPYWLGGPGVRCLVGEVGACEAGVQSVAGSRGASGFPRDLTWPSQFSFQPGVTLTTPRPPAEFFLSDLIRDKGRERFRTFWTSDQPLPHAFAAAFGEPLGAWTSRWALRQWRASWEAKHRSEAIMLGTRVAPSWPLLVLGWSILALLSAVVVASRRQVG